MESKYIANIVLYKCYEGSEIVKKACIFYKDGTIKETSYEEGRDECEKLAKELKLSSADAFEKLINNKLIHVMSGEEFKKNFDSFIPKKEETKEETTEADTASVESEPEATEEFDSEIEDEELKRESTDEVIETEVEEIEEEEKEGLLSRAWKKIKRNAGKITALAVAAGLIGFAVSGCNKKLKSKEGKINKNNISMADSIDNGIVNSVPTAIPTTSTVANVDLHTGNNSDYNNYTYEQLLKVSTSTTQNTAMTYTYNRLKEFNGEFSKSYIEKDKTVNGNPIRAALSFEEMTAIQQAYNDYSKEEIKEIFNGSEVDAIKMSRSYKDASLQLMSAYAMETKEHSFDLSEIIRTQKGKDFYNKYHSMFLAIKEAKTYEEKSVKVTEFYKAVRVDFPITQEVRTEGIAHADAYKTIESYKLSVTPMIAAVEMMYQNLETDVTLNDSEIDFLNDIGLCNYADDKFERIETITLAAQEDKTSATYEQYKNALVREFTSSEKYGYVIDDATRELTKLDAFQKAVNWHFEIVGEGTYEESSSSYETYSSYSQSSTTYRTEESRVSKPITPEAKAKVDSQIASENANNKKKAEEEATKKQKELQAEEDKKSEQIKKEVEKENKDLQNKIDEANEKIKNNNKDTDKTNDTPVNERDFGSHNVDFDDAHSDAQGNLNDSVENITTDGTGAAKANDPLPDPNETGARFDSQAGTFYGDNGYKFSGSFYEYSSALTNEEIVDSYVENLVESNYEEEAYQYTYSNN